VKHWVVLNEVIGQILEWARLEFGQMNESEREPESNGRREARLVAHLAVLHTVVE
jgi:hypothetical protein